ncbi:competence protein ComJ [Desmospora activa]|uniref:competence protein ComJ n=1 Tax=Desmospora activa TaxID=500615 RepID=UPI00147656B5|nr:competence protein ComJ [Desmospora activa]
MNRDWSIQEITISYSQLAVFNSEIKTPYPDWTEDHVRQGFAWMDGSVSFGALSDSTCEIWVRIAERVVENDDAIRSIIVPFTAWDETISVASVLSTELQYEVPQNRYELVFHAIPLEQDSGSGLYRVRYELVFVPSDSPQARILKQDAALSSPDSLVMVAEPAI